MAILNGGMPWTDEDDARLAELFAHGLSLYDIGTEKGRTPEACRKRSKRTPPQTKAARQPSAREQMSEAAMRPPVDDRQQLADRVRDLEADNARELLGAFSESLRLGLPGGLNTLQHREEAGHAGPITRWEVGPAHHRIGVGCQEHRQR